MEQYGVDAYQQAAAAEQTEANGNGWYEGGEAAPAAAATTEPEGQFIPTTGGGPMRAARGASRFNPMAGRKPAAGDAGTVASAVGAEKNELGFIIFAYNIGYQTDEASVYSLFQPYGTVAKVNVIQDFNRGQGKGYGFVTMPNQQEAEAAVSALNGADFDGNTLQIRFKTPKGQGPPAGVMSRGRGRGGPRGGGGGFRGARGAPRGGGFRGGRGAPRGAPRGRGRGAYSQAPSAYDQGYGYGAGGYGDYGYAAPAAGGYGYDEYAAADPYAYPAGGSGYASYGAAGGW